MNQFLIAKKKGQKITMLTAYDSPFAQCAALAGVDVLLVGDSAANVVFGLPSTREITLEVMEWMVSAVRRGAPKLPVIGDLPYGCDTSPEVAIRSAQRLLVSGADSVKIEGFHPEIIQSMIDHQIPVVAHLGLLPQTATKFTQTAKTDAEQELLLHQALELQKMGVLMLVLEHIPTDLAKRVTLLLEIPTIGIGAGPDCDGQVMVLHDMLGLSSRIPPLAHGFVNLRNETILGMEKYRNWVRDSSDLQSLKSSHTDQSGTRSSGLYGSEV
jgi:3-methyl-2-oxobutanoate hydroxymethyltransferase